MSELQLDRDDMIDLLSKAEEAEASYSAGLEGLPTFPDGGLASEQIAFVVRLSLEGGYLAANATAGVCEVARAAVEDLTLTELEIEESLNNFSDGAFDD